MSDLIEYGLEMEKDTYGSDPELMPRKVTPIRRGSIGGKIVALALGFVLGVGGTVGGVVGAGYYVATQPIQTTVDTVNSLAGTSIDLSQYLNEEYAKKTVLGLAGDVATLASKFSSGVGCLNDLVTISPFVSTAIDPVLEAVSGFGLTIDKEGLLATPVSALPDFFIDAAMQTKVIDLLTTLDVQLDEGLKNVLCYDENGEAITVKQLAEGGFDKMLATMPLESFLFEAGAAIDPQKNAFELALAYGNQNRYTLTEGNPIQMNPVVFTKSGDVYYDIDGNKVTVNADGTMELYGNTVYVKASEEDANVYLAYADAEFAEVVCYKKTMIGDLMNGGTSDLLNSIQLGSIFNVSPLDENADPITLSLAYGEKGIHYDVVEGELVWLINPETNEPYAPKTVNDLLSGDFNSIINEMKLGTVLGISPADSDADPLMLALAYGYEDTDYTVDPVTLEVTYITAPKTILSLTQGDIFSTLRIGTVLGLDIFAQPGDEGYDAMSHAIAFGYPGTHYIINDNKVEWQTNPTTNEKYDYRTVGSMSNMGDMLGDLRVETALGVTADSPKLLLALAYGSYTLEVDPETNKNVLTNVSDYHTISELSSTENNLFDSLKLKDFLDEESIESNMLLSHLGNETLGTLPGAVEKLTFKQIYPRQIYKCRYLYNGIVLSYDQETKKYYYMDGDNKITYEGDLADLTVEYEYTHVRYPDDHIVNASGYVKESDLVYNADTGFYDYVDGDTVYEVHLALTPQWKYLLLSDDVDGHSHDYPLTDFSQLVSNMTYNMQNAKLYDLSADGIVSLSSETLNTSLVTDLNLDALGHFQATFPGFAEGEEIKLGDLTILQLMDYTAALIKFVGTLQNP